MNEIKVMIISTVGLTYDGVTNVILSYLRAMDRKSISFHVVSTIVCDKQIRNELIELGCIVVDVPNRKNETIKYLLALLSYIRKNRIDVIHVHGNSGTMAFEMVTGFLGGCKKRICHSHSTQTDNPRVDRLLRPFLYAFSTLRIACGKASGEWLYNKQKYIVLKNGRDCNKYSYQEQIRNRVRTENRWENRTLVGHVGSFVPVKNHMFILDIFRELLKIKDDIELVLVGDGPLYDSVREAAEDIKDKVHFLGVVNNIPEILNAMDVMVLPSFYEGVPLVVLEWQLSGLPCYISSKVDRECIVTDLVRPLPLEDASVWAKEIDNLTMQDRELKSKEAIVLLTEAGFDISCNAQKLREIYIK